MFASYETDEEENRCNSNPISSWRQKKKQNKSLRSRMYEDAKEIGENSR
jgi:hypothetical protein